MKMFNKNTIIMTLAVILFSFIVTVPVSAAGPASVDLLSANNFVILSQTGITNTGSHTSVITGDIGSSPISATAMNNVFCSEMIGTIYGVDNAYVGSGDQTCFAGNPPLSNKTLVDNAVLDMGSAYTDAAGRTIPTATELGAGNIGGMTLAPGLYKWSTDVNIPTNLVLSGGASDVWIFQISGNLNIASGGSVLTGTKVILSGGAQASNIFWQVGGVTGATLGTYSTFNGNILSAKQVIIQTGVVLRGRAFAQTQVTLDANVISFPTILFSSDPIVLTLIKNIVGGTRTINDFPLTATGPTTFTGVSGTSLVTNIIVDAGLYNFSELAQIDYTAGQWSCIKNGGVAVLGDSVTLASGDNVSCTITNTYITPPVAPNLTVTKIVVDGTKVVSDFSLFIDAVSVTSGVVNISTLGTHTVSETPDATYGSVIAGDCASDGTITLSSGDNATCTITNTYIPVTSSVGGNGVIPAVINVPPVIVPVLNTIVPIIAVSVQAEPVVSYEQIVIPVVATVPILPMTGFSPVSKINILIFLGSIMLVSIFTSFVLIKKN
jgi:hypothetical protein